MKIDQEKLQQVQLALPGLELGGEEMGGPKTPLRAAVEATLEALAKDRLLEPRHTALAALALELADAVTAGRRSGRASAAAMAAGQLRDTLLALPEPGEAGAGEKWEQVVLAIATGKAPAAISAA